VSALLTDWLPLGSSSSDRTFQLGILTWTSIWWPSNGAERWDRSEVIKSTQYCVQALSTSLFEHVRSQPLYAADPPTGPEVRVASRQFVYFFVYSISFSLCAKLIGKALSFVMSSESSKPESLPLRSPEDLGTWIGERQDR
jgi:hypothetical protein